MIDENYSDPAEIIADMLATTLMPSGGTWANARALYCWERAGLRYLEQRKAAGDRPPINAWTAMLLDEGYPAAKSGLLQGTYWAPRTETA